LYTLKLTYNQRPQKALVVLREPTLSNSRYLYGTKIRENSNSGGNFSCVKPLLLDANESLRPDCRQTKKKNLGTLSLYLHTKKKVKNRGNGNG
jgi:hypothetical protein